MNALIDLSLHPFQVPAIAFGNDYFILFYFGLLSLEFLSLKCKNNCSESVVLLRYIIDGYVCILSQQIRCSAA